MLTPYSFVTTARAALLVMVPLAMVLAWTSASRTFYAEGLSFLVVPMIMAQLGILAMPWRRRNDTLQAVALAAVVIAALRSGLTGSPSFSITIPAALTGVMAVWLTLEIEEWRRMARTYGDTSFAIIRVETDRRMRKKAQAQAQARAKHSQHEGEPVQDTAKVF